MKPFLKDELRAMKAVEPTWSFRAPEEYLAHIDWDDPDDPLRRQVVPSLPELDVSPAELVDPIGDERFRPVPRLVHRYPHRVLLMPSEDCPVHCRFCFRRGLLTHAQEFSREALRPALDYLARHKEIREVILTGGEPLSLAPEDLSWLCRELDATPHLALLRVHTRLPVVSPSALRVEHVQALRGRLPCWVVVHVNHPRELHEASRGALKRLEEAGCRLLSQSVLLAGVNDDAETLSELFHGLLYDCRVRPYYLHHCDLAPGTRHLRTSIERGRALHDALRGRLSGLALPRYVLDLPGGDGKVTAEPAGLRKGAAEDWQATGWRRVRRTYREVL